MSDAIYSERKKFFSRHLVHWAMNIFYETANECHGFMLQSVYDFLHGVETRNDDVRYMYMPEDEFLARIKANRPILDFNKVFEDSKRHAPVGMPWVEKLKYISMLSNQRDLDPALFGDESLVHAARKALLARWLDAMAPYYINWHLFSFSQKPMLSESMVKLQISIQIVGRRDLTLGGDGFRFAVERVNELAAVRQAK